MSGLAAILHLDGRPAEPREIERMLDAIAHRGPDGSGIWRGGPTALGHRMFHTTPESLDETQPHCDETGDYRLIFDGRIDNVAELRHALEERGLRPRATTDAEIVLRSYQCWGEPFVEKLLGDFALAIWDARAETLLCARDALGVKPLYYYGDGRIFVCGSEINALLSHPEIPRQPNEGMVGEYLAYQRATGGETLFRSIMRLRPGHVLTASQGRISVRRYFDLDPRKELRYLNDDEYAEHFLDIFKESVRCRMRCAGPLAMQLSGGLDSSSIVCTAHKFFDGGPSSPSRFKTYSLTFPGLVDDETDYINEALRHTGVRGDLLTHNPTGEFDNFEWVRKHRDFPEYPNHLSMLRLWEAVRGDGARVLLTGLGGDECFSGCLDDIADLLRRGELRSLMRQVRIDSLQSPVRFGEKIGALHIFLAKGLLPLLPRAMQRMAHGLAGHKQSFPPWIDPGFARRIALEERLTPAPARAAPMSIARRDFYDFMHYGDFFVVVDEVEHSHVRNGLEVRHPFLDRRVVEFAWAIPEDQCRRFGEERRIVRNAMRGVLPEKIRARFSKASFEYPFHDAMKRNGGKIAWDNLKIAGRGWVDPAVLKNDYSELIESYDKGVVKYSGRMWMAIAMEIWHNVIFGGARS